MGKAIEKVNVEEVQVEEVPEKPYTLRDLKDRDLFPLLQIFKKIGIKEYKEAFVQVASGGSLDEVGMNVAFDMAEVMIGNLHKAETEIYALYSDMSGIPVEDIKEMEFGTLPMMIVDSFKGARNTSFFKVLAKLLS